MIPVSPFCHYSLSVRLKYLLLLPFRFPEILIVSFGWSVTKDEQFGDPSFVAELKEEAYNLIAKINGYLAYLRKKTSEK